MQPVEPHLPCHAHSCRSCPGKTTMAAAIRPSSQTIRGTSKFMASPVSQHQRSHPMKKGRDSTNNLRVNKGFKMIENVGFVYRNGTSDLKPETTATICNYLRTSPLPTSPPREFLFKPCHFCRPLESWVPDTRPNWKMKTS